MVGGGPDSLASQRSARMSTANAITRVKAPLGVAHGSRSGSAKHAAKVATERAFSALDWGDAGGSTRVAPHSGPQAKTTLAGSPSGAVVEPRSGSVTTKGQGALRHAVAFLAK
jgi:hypothetical protein